MCALVYCHNVFYHYKFESRIFFMRFFHLVPHIQNFAFCFSFLLSFYARDIQTRSPDRYTYDSYVDATLRWFTFKWHDSVCARALLLLLLSFLQLLGAHSLWILDRETVNKKKKKISSKRISERTGTKRKKKKSQTCIECLFFYFFCCCCYYRRANETLTVEFSGERLKASATKRNDEQKSFCSREKNR